MAILKANGKILVMPEVPSELFVEFFSGIVFE